ncbi:MAG: lamin tail domain-containing protein [Deltaproteobacteria bacterium]|nr:lamin tail domain-containing protein [Deltaproteobacteria bacterium]
MLRRSFGLVLLSTLVLTVACGGKPPTLLAIGNQTVAAGETLTIDIAASDPDTSRLSFSAENLPAGSTLDSSGEAQARFRWVPTAADVGDHHVDFFVTDGRSIDSEAIVITVTSGGGTDGPEFVGQTTWVLEADQKSIQKTIEVRDDAATSIDWTIQGNPAGSTFTPLIKRAVFFWEPDATQRQQPQYTFSVTARNPATDKSADQVFTILIRNGGSTTCTTNKPNITSTTPATLDGANDFSISANVTDAESKVQKVTVSYAFGASPAAADFVNLDMIAGTDPAWTASARRATDLGPGEFDTLNYEICATDDDDTTGDACDQQTCTGRLTVNVRLAGGGGLCESCSSDAGCGTAEDRCVTTLGTPFCGVDCSGGGSCPTGYTCTDLGGTISQCTPVSGTCGSSGSPAAQPGDLIINEVLADPPADTDVNGDGIASTTGDEFIEIVSYASSTVDIGGVTVADGTQVRFTFPLGATLGAGEAVVLFGGGNTGNFTGIGNATAYAASSNGTAGTLGLNNTGDSVQLRTPAGQVIDAMSYGASAGQDESVTLDNQVGGIIYVRHSQATGSSTPYSPGTVSCGGNFPVSGNVCNGAYCGDRAQDADTEPNNDLAYAGCLFDTFSVGFTGSLHYVGGTGGPGPDPWDYFIFWAPQGTRLDLLTSAVSGQPEINTTISILDSTGIELAFGDDTTDGSGNLTSFYSEINGYVVPADGTYYVAIATYQGSADQNGAYEFLMVGN